MSVKDKVEAIDRFVRTLKSGSNVYDDINAACIMAGWTNLAGALTPLKGTAPTNGGGLFQDADLDPGIGLKGDGSSKYLNSNRANNADNYRDRHASTYASDASLAANNDYRLGVTTTSATIYHAASSSSQFLGRDANSIYYKAASDKVAGLVASSRADNTGVDWRLGGETVFHAGTSTTAGDAEPYGIFCRNSSGTFQDLGPYALSWYSIGSSTDLAALDSAVSTLMEDLRSIDEQGFDPSALAYIRAVEAADGSFLEGGVKKAINRFIVGCKKDGTWDAIKASCILCGARTIAGALVPLAGTAPTAYNFTSANYDRETGLIGVPASNTYIDTNRANNADPQDDQHMVVYKTDATSEANPYYVGAFSGSSGSAVGEKGMYANSTATFAGGAASGSDVGLHGFSRTASNVVAYKRPAYGVTTSNAASNSHHSLTNVAFAIRTSGGPVGLYTGSRFAFYSIGTSLDLAALDARVSTLVSEIAAAIP